MITYTPHLSRFTGGVSVCWRTKPWGNIWTLRMRVGSQTLVSVVGGGVGNLAGMIRTQSPSSSFLMARSTASWYIPTPRTVSMTFPFLNKAECNLENRWLFVRMGVWIKYVTYGLVNRMSLAPSVHREVRLEKKDRTGSIPHIRGSSKLFVDPR
jgi:hypothetical protein